MDWDDPNEVSGQEGMHLRGRGVWGMSHLKSTPRELLEKGVDSVPWSQGATIAYIGVDGRLWSRTTQAHIPALLLTSGMTLGKLSNLSVPQFLHP